MNKIKFLDEAHFASRKDLCRLKGLSKIGEPVIVVQNGNINDRASVTILTSWIPEGDPTPPLTIDIRKKTNNQFTFLAFICYCLRTQKLDAGDILVMDNARIHTGRHIFETLELLLNLAGVQLVFLPAYSPELNPCELVFQASKMDARSWAKETDMGLAILQSFRKITSKSVKKMYFNCKYTQWK